jgi:hypothetical protein
MNFLSRNFINLFILMVIGGLGLGAYLAQSNANVPYLSQLKPTATPTQSLRPSGAAAAPQLVGPGSVAVGTPQATTSGTPVAGQPQGQGANPGAGRILAGRATIGTVDGVDGKTISVKTQDGSTVKVTVSDATTYQKSTTITAADIKVGDIVAITGQDGGDGSVTAQSVQVGGATAGGLPALGGLQTPGGQAPGGQAPGGAARGTAVRLLNGAVQKVEGTTLTVAADGGQTVKVVLAADARLVKNTTAALGDVKAGEQVMIIGQAGSDGVVAATSVQLGVVQFSATR